MRSAVSDQGLNCLPVRSAVSDLGLHCLPIFHKKSLWAYILNGTNLICGWIYCFHVVRQSITFDPMFSPPELMAIHVTPMPVVHQSVRSDVFLFEYT